MTIKAIETRYAGCRFRSRLEARWAVFFDAMGMEWQYEPEGFELPSGWYLPDFYLPAGDMWGSAHWAEVKGVKVSERERQFAAELTESSHTFVHLLEGDIPRKAGWTSGEHPCLVTPIWGWRNTGDLARDLVTDPRREWTTDVFAYGAMIPSALNAARSARFEHGESGAARVR